MATDPSATLRIEIAAGPARAAAALLAQVPQPANSAAANESDSGDPCRLPDELWGAWRGDALVAALRVVSQPGRTAAISPPRSISGEPISTSAELIREVLRQQTDRGTRLVQALLTFDHGPDADALLAGGMRHLANLLYLVSLAPAFPEGPPAPQLTFTPTTVEQEARLGRIMERTYQGTLDCPGLESAREIGDVLDGYRAAGPFAPERWLIVSCAGQDIGCLLLADDRVRDQCELTYLGVVPEARGRGYGLLLARQGQWIAGGAGRKRVVVAVDAANQPALSAYAAAGFVGWDHRSVFVHVPKAESRAARGRSV